VSTAKIGAEHAFYSQDHGLYLLLQDDMRNAPDPDTALMEFCQSTYEAGANLANWDRASLER